MTYIATSNTYKGFIHGNEYESLITHQLDTIVLENVHGERINFVEDLINLYFEIKDTCITSSEELEDIVLGMTENALTLEDWSKAGRNPSGANNSDNNTPYYYNKRCSCDRKIDPYMICDLYEGEGLGSSWHHAVKKLLRAGQGHKSLNQDVEEVISTLQRWQEDLPKGE